MKKYKYLSKQNKNSLLNNNDIELIRNKVIIQKSDFSEILLFDKIDDFLKFNNDLKKEDKVYYEVIFGDDIQKFKLDIDIKRYKKYNSVTDECYININDKIKINELINDLIKSTFDLINCNKFKYYIYDSSDYKNLIISKHIIFDFYIYNSNEAKELYNKLISVISKKYNNNIIKLIDNTIYKTQQCFRLPHHTKINNKRYKECENHKDDNVVAGMIKNYLNEKIHVIKITNENEEESSINNNDGDVSENHNNHQWTNDLGKISCKTKTNKVQEIPEEIIEIILEKGKNYLNNFKIRNTISNKIIFDRLRAGFCEICKRIHENENSLYIIVYDNKFRIYCRRNEEKYIEINIKTNDTNIKMNKYIMLKNNLKKENNVIGYYNFDNYFKKDNLISYNNNKLKEFDFKNKKVLIIHANVKIGKTKELNKYLKDNPDIKNVIIISFRILFSVELKSKFKEFTNYLDIKKKSYSLKDINKIIIQLDSLYKLNIDITPDLLILDESESILNQFSSPYIKNIKMIWEIFQFLLKTSKKILFMDANITCRSINLLHNIFNNNNIIYHHNFYSTICNDFYYLIFNFNSFISLLCYYIDKNNKIIIPVNSLKKAKIIYKFLITKYKKLNIKIYTSETNDFEKKEDLSDVNLHWLKYDIIIYSPTITAGISFEMKHFDYLFGYFTNSSCDVYSIYQMIHRVRNLNKHKIYIMFDVLKTNNLLSNDKIDIIESIKYSFKQLYNESLNFNIEYINDQTINKIDDNDIFYKLWLDNKFINNKSHFYMIYEFIDLLKKNNCKYEFIFNNNYDNIIDVNFIAKELIHDDNYKLLKSPDINIETYQILCNNTELSCSEKFIKKRFFLRQLYNYFDDIDISFLNIYNDQNIINKCINLIKVKNFSININTIVNNILTDYDAIYNSCMKIMLTEKILLLKKTIDIINLTGLNIYKSNDNILYDDFISNITLNNNEILNIFKIMDLIISNISFKDIKKLLENTFDITFNISKLNHGSVKYINLIKSNYFKDTFPIEINNIITV